MYSLLKTQKNQTGKVRELLSIVVPPRDKWLISCCMFFHSASLPYKYFPKMIAYCMLVSIDASQTSLCTNKYNFTSVIFQPSEGHQDHLGASTNQTCVPVCRFSHVPLDGGCPQVTVWGSLIEMGVYMPRRGWEERR